MKKEVILGYPLIIKEYLYNININDSFFDSLKEDHFEFEKWYQSKSLAKEMAYISYNDTGQLGAFLMLKEEDYSNFTIPFAKDKRLKILTFKVADTGKKIGEVFLKIAVNFAILNNITEIYITIFNKHRQLIKLLQEYGFYLYTTKQTSKANSVI